MQVWRHEHHWHLSLIRVHAYVCKNKHASRKLLPWQVQQNLRQVSEASNTGRAVEEHDSPA
jgi:hypothetical protein